MTVQILSDTQFVKVEKDERWHRLDRHTLAEESLFITLCGIQTGFEGYRLGWSSQSTALCAICEQINVEMILVKQGLVVLSGDDMTELKRIAELPLVNPHGTI